MKNYIVTVNGVSYEVSVEEVGEGQAAAPAAAPVKAAPVKAAAPAKKAKASGAAGSVKVSAPMIGSAGVSAVPMAARVSQKVGAEEDPTNFLLMHAMGPNVAGVIGTAVAAGVFMAIFGA